jgi:hypothetical protein
MFLKFHQLDVNILLFVVIFDFHPIERRMSNLQNIFPLPQVSSRRNWCQLLFCIDIEGINRCKIKDLSINLDFVGSGGRQETVKTLQLSSPQADTLELGSASKSVP